MPEDAGVVPILKPPKGAGAAAGLLASSLAGSAGLAPNENPPLAGAAGGAAGVSFFSAGFAPNEKPEAAGAAGAGVDELSAGFAPKEKPEAAGAGGAAEPEAGALSAGFPNEKPDKGGLEAGVVEPAAALLFNPEKRPPAALPAFAAGAAGVLVPDAAGLSLFRPANENDGIALPDDGAPDNVALFVFD